jgi:CheY-like chemotaxis protein
MGAAVDLTNIVIVEDDPCLQTLICHTLKPICERITVTDSINMAKDVVTHQKQSLIILDLQLVDGHGRELIEFIESNPAGLNFQTPIIVLSGSIDTKFLKSYSMRVTRSQSKPLKPQDLVKLVLNVSSKN